MIFRRLVSKIKSELKSGNTAAIYVHSSASVEPNIDDAELLEYYSRLERERGNES